MPRLGKPRIILWDVMGTLVHDPFFAEVPQFFGMSLEALIEAKHPTAWVEFEHARIDEDQMLQRFFADGRAFDGAGLKATMQAAYRLLNGIEPLLNRLRDASVPMHALSNYPRWYELIEAELELSRWLQWSFVSCITGARKPDAAAYEAALESLGVDAGECLFIDDREANCDGARAVGMHAVRFRSSAALQPELARLGFG